jgi:hypothetical protein
MNVLPPISLIILNWNGRRYLEDCLSSLFELDYPDFSVLVVDNASTDDSVAFVERHYPRVQVCCNNRNLGYAAGSNVGLRKVQTDFSVLLNPDIVVSRDWLRKLITPFLQDETIGIAGCKMHYPGGRRIQHAGGYITYPLALPGHYGLNEEDEGQFDTLRDVDYVIGAALAFRRSAVTDIGFLDEGFFLFFEDADWCIRATRAGYRVVYVPDAALVHVESPLTKKGSDAYLRHLHTSRWRYLLKHYDADDVLRDTMPAEMAWLTDRAPRERRALAGGYRTTLKNLPAIWMARERDGGSIVKPVTKEQDAQIVERLQELRAAAWEPSEPALNAEPGGRNGTGEGDHLYVDDPLKEKWHVQEKPFESPTPVIGPLIARFREAWNSVSTKWFVRRLFQQQNEYNWLVLGRFEQLQRRMDELDTRMIENDRDETALARELGQLTYAVVRLEKRLAEMETRLEGSTLNSGQKS